MERGVYFLANDAILDQALAFLASFRKHNPRIPLCLVPFAADSDRIREHAARYKFDVWADDAVLKVCDEISRAFHAGTVMGQYRKLAMWTGPYEQFIYIDSDTVVLHSIDFVFGYLDRYDFFTSHSNMPHNRRWVWRDSIYHTGALTDRQIEFATSTGFVASRRGLIDPRTTYPDLAAPLSLAPHMELLCTEQPLLNYLIVTSGRPHSSLSVIAEATGDPDIPQEQWAGEHIGDFRAGRLVPTKVRHVLLVHWAGEWQRVRAEGGQVPYHDLWHHYRSMANTKTAADEQP